MDTVRGRKMLEEVVDEAQQRSDEILGLAALQYALDSTPDAWPEEHAPLLIPEDYPDFTTMLQEADEEAIEDALWHAVKAGDGDDAALCLMHLPESFDAVPAVEYSALRRTPQHTDTALLLLSQLDGERSEDAVTAAVRACGAVDNVDLLHSLVTAVPEELLDVVNAAEMALQERRPRVLRYAVAAHPPHKPGNTLRLVSVAASRDNPELLLWVMRANPGGNMPMDRVLEELAAARATVCLVTLAGGSSAIPAHTSYRRNPHAFHSIRMLACTRASDEAHDVLHSVDAEQYQRALALACRPGNKHAADFLRVFLATVPCPGGVYPSDAVENALHADSGRDMHEDAVGVAMLQHCTQDAALGEFLGTSVLARSEGNPCTAFISAGAYALLAWAWDPVNPRPLRVTRLLQHCLRRAVDNVSASYARVFLALMGVQGECAPYMNEVEPRSEMGGFISRREVAYGLSLALVHTDPRLAACALHLANADSGSLGSLGANPSELEYILDEVERHANGAPPCSEEHPARALCNLLARKSPPRGSKQRAAGPLLHDDRQG